MNMHVLNDPSPSDTSKAPGNERTGPPRHVRQSYEGHYSPRTFAACLPFGPSTTSNSTDWPSLSVR